MAPEISLEHQRPAEFVFERLVEQAADSRSAEPRAGQRDHAA